MARIILMLLIITAIAVAVFWLGQRAVLATQSTREARLPDTVKTISFVLLILLMFGVVTGWLGGL
jgi:multidrug resistance efflux pump